MIPIRGLSRISRVVNLSFKVTGLKEQSGAVQALVSGIQKLIHLIIMATMAYRGLMMALMGNPFGWLLLAITGLTGISALQGLFASGAPTTEFEEYRARNP